MIFYANLIHQVQAVMMNIPEVFTVYMSNTSPGKRFADELSVKPKAMFTGLKSGLIHKL
jgi:hypothetical protein